MEKTPLDKLTVRVATAADLLDISRAKAYELLAARILPSIRVGRSVRVPVAALTEWVRRQATPRDK
jgi:excisionase family DNA binding protein